MSLRFDLSVVHSCTILRREVPNQLPSIDQEACAAHGLINALSSARAGALVRASSFVLNFLSLHTPITCVGPVLLDAVRATCLTRTGASLYDAERGSIILMPLARRRFPHTSLRSFSKR